MEFLYEHVVPYLPEDLQLIARDPPNLSRPETFVTFVRVTWPYLQLILAVFALYVIYAIVTGFIGYLARFLRVVFKITPIIGLIAWVMAATGQGTMGELFQSLKQYAGLAELDTGYPRGAPPRRAPGWETPGAGATYGRRQDTPPAGAGSSYRDSRTKPHQRSSPYRSATRNNNQPQEDPFAGLFEDGMGAAVQGFVRQALARAAGIDWLLPTEQPATKEKEKDKTRSP